MKSNSPTLPAFRAVLNRYHGKTLSIAHHGLHVYLQQVLRPGMYQRVELLYEAQSYTEAHKVALKLLKWLRTIQAVKEKSIC